ncbi:MAG: SulP family inorganic anion transporter [Acidobacteriota bacterium]
MDASAHKRLEPKLFTVLRSGYTRKLFFADLSAGLIVGIVALPLAIAFAIASGVKPEQGLYTAIIAGFIVAVMGGTRVQISGPTGAFIVIIYGIVQRYGFDGLATATLIAGVLLVIMGLARLGNLLKFIPYPLTVGFTSGIALIIFSGQVKDFLGLQIANVPADFMEKWYVYFHSFSTLNYWALGIGVLSLLIVMFTPRFSAKVPGSLAAIIVATMLVQYFQLPVETIGSRFGSVPNTLPLPSMPKISWSLVSQMFSPAVTIALLAAIESLLSAVVADGMIGSRHRSNMELIALGTANFFTPFFGGIPATGAIARTATNIKNGGRTPISGIVHSVVLLLIMLLFGRWAALIPMPALAAILIVVAYNMSEWHSFVRIFSTPRSDVLIMVITFLLTVLIDLTVAIEVGILLSALFFLQRMADVSQAQIITREIQKEKEEDETASADTAAVIPPGVEVFEVYGSLFFGAVDQFKDALRQMEKKTKVLIIDMKTLLAIDATGLRALEDITAQSVREHMTIIISGVHKQPLFAMERSGFLAKIGEDNLCGDLDEALARAQTLIDAKRSV